MKRQTISRGSGRLGSILYRLLKGVRHFVKCKLILSNSFIHVVTINCEKNKHVTQQYKLICFRATTTASVV
jgi:hypothetical protein